LNFRSGFQDTPLGALRLRSIRFESDNAQDPLGLSPPAVWQVNPDQTTP